MQQRLTRGIQYEDVARAADALLHEGIRPTIERIRLHIGRGSPNTVSPMLEQWFSGLGKRLGGVESAQNRSSMPGQGAEMPDAVLQMAQALWQKAVSEAQLQSELACSHERERLEAEAQRLHEAQMQLDAREMALNERLNALENALQSCQQQLAGSLHTLTVRDAETATVRSALEQARQQSDGLQHSIHTLQEQLLQERTALEKRHHAAQQRWLVEVDRARQEMRKSALHAEQTALQRSALQQELAALQSDQHAKALEQALLTSALRNELSTTQHAADQTRRLLEKLQAENETLQLQQSLHAVQKENGTALSRMRHASLGKLQGAKAPARRSLKKSLR